MGEREKITLTGVPETLLWPLWSRAAEARHPRGVLRDPRAVEIAESIDYPFEEKLGRPDATHAIRAVGFDAEVRRFLEKKPDATVVALGDGLETQCYRVDNGRVRWLAVDLPETIEVRRKFIPDSARHRNVACSALDLRWLDEVDPSRGVIVTAAGLLYYFVEDDVARLIAGCAERFHRVDGEMIFDTVPRWLSKRTQRGLNRTKSYRIPPMPWGIDVDELPRLRALHEHIVEVREIGFPDGRGFFFGFLAPLLERLPVLRTKRPALVVLRFGERPQRTSG